jgi:protein-disulfide isomerase
MMKRHRLWLLAFLLPMAVAGLIAARAAADESSALHPPHGAKVALVVFEDLQCPDCARAHPLLQEAVKTYKIPLMHYDFPLPQHSWAMNAAVLARYFDGKSHKLGDEFRDEIFKHQSEITPDNLRPFAEKFAAEHKTTLPFAVDPQGKLAAAVVADREFGKRVGITHTPTIYVVTNKRTGTPFVEVVDRTQLFQLIDAMKKEAE